MPKKEDPFYLIRRAWLVATKISDITCIVKKERSNSYSVYRCSCQVRDLHTLNSFSFFLGKICHFIDGLQHSPFYRWKSRCCLLLFQRLIHKPLFHENNVFPMGSKYVKYLPNTGVTNLHFAAQCLLVDSATHLAIIIFWKQHKTEIFEIM